MYILSVILECSILNCIFEHRVLGYFGVSDGEQATKDESQIYGQTLPRNYYIGLILTRSWGHKNQVHR